MTMEELRLKFWNLFYNSSTVFWARFQIFFGCVWFVLSMTDMTPWLPAKYIPVWAIINGIITEYLRRSNAPAKTITVNDRAGVESTVTYLRAASPVPTGSMVVIPNVKKAG